MDMKEGNEVPETICVDSSHMILPSEVSISGGILAALLLLLFCQLP